MNLQAVHFCQRPHIHTAFRRVVVRKLTDTAYTMFFTPEG
jgi:hypothetical protein